MGVGVGKETAGSTTTQSLHKSPDDTAHKSFLFLPSDSQCPPMTAIAVHKIVFAFTYKLPVPVAARSKAWVCGRSPAEIVGSNPTGGHGCVSVISVVCCQVEVSATD